MKIGIPRGCFREQTGKPSFESNSRHSCSAGALAEEIEQALEMLRRVKRAEFARGNHEIQENYGNTYVIPEPVYYPVTKSP
jgi:hypothetical protein